MKALGFIETQGFVAAVEAADSALKAATVSLVTRKYPGSGLVTIIVTGDVAAVKSAVDAGTESAAAVGNVVSSQVIARPHDDMDAVINGTDEKLVARSAPAKRTTRSGGRASRSGGQSKSNPSI